MIASVKPDLTKEKAIMTPRPTYQRDGHWWYDQEDGPVGPYNTRAEAAEDERGTRRSEHHDETPGYWTIDGSKRALVLEN